MVTVLAPHVGGPILPPARRPHGADRRHAGGPRRRHGGLCRGADVIALGSMTVMVGFMPVARMGDMTAHGGAIVAGEPTVMIG